MIIITTLNYLILLLIFDYLQSQSYLLFIIKKIFDNLKFIYLNNNRLIRTL
jgi:hypothetical protein